MKEKQRITKKTQENREKIKKNTVIIV